MRQYKEKMLEKWWYEDTVRTTNEKIRKINKYCYNQAPLSEISVTAETIKLIEWYESFLREKLLSYGFEIVPNPNNMVFEKIINKAIERKKPFEINSDKWFKDAVIWESYLEILDINQWEIILLSDNYNDYWGDDKNWFHEDLASELWSLPWIYRGSINDVRNEYLEDIIPHMSLESLERNLNLKNLQEYLTKYLENYKLNITDCEYYGDLKIDSIFDWDMWLIEFNSIYIASKSEALTKLELTISIATSFNIIAYLIWDSGSSYEFKWIKLEWEITIDIELNNYTGEVKRIYNDLLELGEEDREKKLKEDFSTSSDNNDKLIDLYIESVNFDYLYTQFQDEIENSDNYSMEEWEMLWMPTQLYWIN